MIPDLVAIERPIRIAMVMDRAGSRRWKTPELVPEQRTQNPRITARTIWSETLSLVP
jgi:hypothetical protein